MAFRTKAPRTEDPGIGSSFDGGIERLMAADGSFRVSRPGGRGGVREAFVLLVTMAAGRLVITLLLGYLALNVLFASLYMLAGVQHLANAQLGDLQGRWMSAFGMSIQTLTTVGYGSVYPTTPLTWAIAAIEGVCGILVFSLISAVIYARFARPTTRLAWSDAAVIAPFGEGWSLQVRLANRRSTLLTEVEARMLLVMAEVDDQGERLSYFNLKLQIDRVSFLPLTWTLVHAVAADSPLAGASLRDLQEKRAEVLVLIKGIDEAYMQQVMARRSYTHGEVCWGGRFQRAFGSRAGRMHLEIDRLSEVLPQKAPVTLPPAG